MGAIAEDGTAAGSDQEPSAFTPGSSREVVIEFRDRHGRPQTLRTQLARWTDDRFLLLPRTEQRRAPVPEVGQHLRLRLVATGVVATAKVIGRDGADGAFVVSRPVINAAQSRRGLYRVDVSLDLITSLGPARITNLSGSGCLLVLPRGVTAPPEHQRVQLHLRLPEAGGAIDAEGRVVRATVPDEGGVRLGIAFVDLAPGPEQRIVRYVFARQAELLRRGLLTPGTPLGS